MYSRIILGPRTYSCVCARVVRVSFAQLPLMALLMKCDYFGGLPGVGPAKAKEIVDKAWKEWKKQGDSKGECLVCACVCV